MTDERPTLLLLHDEGRSPDQWREFVPLLESRFDVIAPDVPAGDRAERLAAAREAVAGRRPVGVIGHGDGGELAQLLASGGDVGAMVLLGAPRADALTDEHLAAFEFPVLLLWGEEDETVPSAVGEELNDAIPSSTLGLLPGCGHDIVGEAAATIAPMILEYLRARFLGVPHHEAHGHGHEGVVRIQLERRPPWVDLEEDERDDWFDVDDDDEEVVP